MRTVLMVALLTLWLGAYTFENKPRVDDINSSIQTLVNNVQLDSVGSKLLVTRTNGSGFSIDLSSVSGTEISLDDVNKKMVLTKTDGTTSDTDISELYDNVNIAGGVLDPLGKSINLTLNDNNSTLIFIDIANIADVIPNATILSDGLLSKKDKKKLNRTFKFFSFSVADDNDTLVTLAQVAGTVLPSVNFARDKMRGFMVGNGTDYMLSTSYKFHIKDITGATLPSDGNFDVRFNLEAILTNTTESAGTTVIGGGGGSAIAMCRTIANSDLPPIPLNVTVSASDGIRFYSPDTSNISDSGSSANVGDCIIAGTLIT